MLPLLCGQVQEQKALGQPRMYSLFQGAPSLVLSHPHATAHDLVRLQVHMLLDWLTEGPGQLTEQQLVRLLTRPAFEGHERKGSNRKQLPPQSPTKSPTTSPPSTPSTPAPCSKRRCTKDA